MALTEQQISQMNQITGMNRPTNPTQAAGQSRAQQIMAIAQKAKPSNPVGDFATGVGKAAAGFVGQADVLGTMNRIQKGDTAGLKSAGGALLDSVNPLGTMHSLAGEKSNWTGVQSTDEPSKNPDWSGISPAQREEALQPSNFTQKLGETTAVVAANLAPFGHEAMPTIKDTMGKVKDAMTPKPPTPEEAAASKLQNAASEKANAAKAHEAIDTEIRNTAAKYPSVGKVLNQSETARGNEPVKVLSSYAGGKALPTLVKGKLQTDGATNFLKKQVGTLSEIKKNLVATAKEGTPVQDFQQAALDRVDKMDWSAAKRNAIKADIQKSLAGFEETYPKGISNPEMDMLKTEHANESTSYNSKSAFQPDTHAIIGQTAKDIVETKGGEAPISELNKLISSHYDAIKLLNTMRGKTPHGGALSRMFNNTIGEVGGLAAGLPLGHPFIGAMAGRAGAEAVNEIINNHFISNPLKRSLVNNMKNADPEVVQKATEFLNQSTQKDATAPTEEPPKTSSPNDTTPDNPVKPLDWTSEKGAVKNPFFKEDTPESVSPQKVAQNIGGTDIPLIQDYVNEPSLKNLMKLQPLIEPMGLETLDPSMLQRFLQEVISERNSPEFTTGTKYNQDVKTGKMQGKK